MKGLLIKDFMLMKRQGSFYLVILFSAILLGFFAKAPTFVVGYLVFICSQFVLTSISYDEFDNGNPFLFSLPVTRKGYVAEKYVFGFVLGSVSLILSGIIVAVAGAVKGTVSVAETVTLCLSVLPMVVIMMSFTLPIQLKFGNEKGILMIMVSLGVIAVIGVGVVKIANITQAEVMSFLVEFSETETGVLITILGAVAIVAVMISYKISCLIVGKKEY